MPVMMDQTSIAGLSTNDNILAGSQWEYLPYNSRVEFGLVGDANAIDLRLDIFSGQDILMENGRVSNAARMPVYPDDFQLYDYARGGERVKIRVRNANAAARTIFWCVRIYPA